MLQKFRIDALGARHLNIVQGIERPKVLFDTSDRNVLNEKLGGKDGWMANGQIDAKGKINRK